MTLKALAIKNLQRIDAGIREVYQGTNEGIIKGKNEAEIFPDCFDPEDYLLALLEQGRRKRWNDTELFEHIDMARHTGALTSPWGILIHDSPIIAGGLYWIISDTTARQRLPVDAISFTTAELKPLMEISSVFSGAKVVKVFKKVLNVSDTNKY